MDPKKIAPGPKPINLKANSDKEFFLIHGYTGSPTDFYDLPEYLHKKFNANVKIPLLKGHGTKVEDLLNYRYSDYISQVKTEFEKEIKKGRKIILGGYSLGGLIALYLASKYKIKGIFVISPPIKLKFPMNLTLLSYIRFLKPIWDKNLPDKEKKEMRFNFYYDKMPSIALKICQDASNDVSKILNKINSPILSIFSGKDDVTSNNASKKIEQQISHSNLKNLIIGDAGHRPSSKKFREFIKKEIISFSEENFLENKDKKKKIFFNTVSAIVPAYNEGERIKNVLEVLAKTKMLNEVVVVDDGSSDNTGEVVKILAKKYNKIKYLRNEINKGKAYSMDRGVKSSKSDIIFFSDSDLEGLTSDIVEQIISPVANNEHSMFIGIRNNVMQKIFTPFGLNSGERAMHREVWESLPDFYKYRYRIEVGLNYFVKLFKKGFGYKQFSHFQTLKEVKYGFWKGTFLRWWMNLDVVVAFLRMNLYDRFKLKKDVKSCIKILSAEKQNPA